MVEPEYIERVAAQYRKDGYGVHVGPSADRLPAVVGDFRPDLLAERDGEHVAVAVTTRQALARDPKLVFVAEALQREPGWRLDVLFTGQGPITSEPLAEHAEPTSDDMDAMLRSARRLIDLGELDAAYLIGWAAVEAGLRAAAHANDVPPPMGTSAAILDAAWKSGLLSGDEYGRLNDAARVRNAIAHGWRTPDAVAADVEELIGFATRLTAGLARPAA